MSKSMQLLLLCTLLCISIAASSVSAVDTYLLDEYPGALIAVAPFQVSTSYSGPLLRVERLSDGVLADVFADNDGYVSLSSPTTTIDASETTDLQTFAQSDTIAVRVFYDQSGNSNDLSTPSGTRSRILMENGNIYQDTFNNVGLHLDSNAPSESGFSIKQLHTDIDLSAVTAITFAQPLWMLTGSSPDQALFNFGPYVSVSTGNRHLLWYYDGAYNRHRLYAGDGTTSSTINSASVDLLNEPAIYFLTVDGTTLTTQSNSYETASAQLTSTIPATNEVQPFAGNDGIKLPMHGYATAFFVYPYHMNENQRNDFYQATTSVYSTTDVSSGDNSALLPQRTQDDITLYEWLQTFDESDFDVPQGDSIEITYESQGADEDQLYGLYYALSGNHPRTDMITYPSSAFVLNDDNGEGIEGDGENVRILRSVNGDEGAQLEAAAYLTFEIPGLNNPYHDHNGLSNRLTTQAVAMMMQVNEKLYWDGGGSMKEYIGMEIMQTMTAFEAGKEYSKDLDPDVREAFYRTVDSVVQYWDDTGGPRDTNTNMDTKAFYGIALLYKAAKEEGLDDIADRALAVSQKWILGSEGATDAGNAQGHITGVVFHSAGYVGEFDMPETSYNGISIYYLGKAAAVVYGEPGWEWLWDDDGVVDRMARFKSYQIFQDPDGRFNGPSGYAVRTGFPYAIDQSSSRGRDMMIAMISDHGIEHFNKRSSLDPSEITAFDAPSISEMETSISSNLNRHYGSGKFTEQSPRYRNFGAGSGDTRWWARRIGTVAFQYYQDGFYNQISSLIAAQHETLQLPHLREGVGYNIPFGRDGENPEFWTYKDGSDPEFAVFIEAFSDDSNAYGSWRGGGTVQSFWTKDAGLVINTRSSKHDFDALAWPNVGQWATHHLWGELDDGSTFSSAQRDSRTTSYSWDNIASPNQVTATNTPDRSSGSFDGVVQYQRTLQKISTGIQITTELTTNQQDMFRNVWESIPIYISMNKGSNAITTIEFTTESSGIDSNSWSSLGQSLMSGITAIRLGRDHGSGTQYVYVVPERAISAQTSAEWQADYQMSDYYKQLMISMHSTPGSATTISESSLIYSIVTSMPDVETPTNQPPSITLSSSATQADADATVTFIATASDSDGSIQSVEFYLDNELVSTDVSTPYSYEWTAQQGSHTVHATATDNDGTQTNSNSVSLTISAPNTPPEDIPDDDTNYIVRVPNIVDKGQELTVEGTDTIVYGVGYYSLNGQAWQPFSFDGQIIGDSWILSSATASIMIPETATTSNYNWIAVFTCSSIETSWDCHGPRWQIERFAVQ